LDQLINEYLLFHGAHVTPDIDNCLVIPCGRIHIYRILLDATAVIDRLGGVLISGFTFEFIDGITPEAYEEIRIALRPVRLGHEIIRRNGILESLGALDEPVLDEYVLHSIFMTGDIVNGTRGGGVVFEIRHAAEVIENGAF
jgi:hypothetical protein